MLSYCNIAYLICSNKSFNPALLLASNFANSLNEIRTISVWDILRRLDSLLSVCGILHPFNVCFP
jgi:hypothetical protein